MGEWSREAAKRRVWVRRQEGRIQGEKKLACSFEKCLFSAHFVKLSLAPAGRVSFYSPNLQHQPSTVCPLHKFVTYFFHQRQTPLPKNKIKMGMEEDFLIFCPLPPIYSEGPTKLAPNEKKWKVFQIADNGGENSLKIVDISAQLPKVATPKNLAINGKNEKCSKLAERGFRIFDIPTP